MKQEVNYFARNKWRNISGTILCLLGILLLFLRTWFMEFLIASVFVLKPDSAFGDNWRYMPDVPLDIYLFNWTNPEDFHNLNIKPKFDQIGPYKFKETREKVDITWNSNNTVTYKLARNIQFDENGTMQNVSAPITTVDTITWCLSHMMRHMSYPLKSLLSTYISASASYMHYTKPARELLYEGFDHFVIDLSNYFPFVFADIPRLHEKFSYLLKTNSSKQLGGTFNIADGTDGTFDVRNWNFNNITPYYQGSCAKAHGSAGELFSKKLSKDYINMFLSEICRSVKLEFEEEVMVEGVLGYKYSVGEAMLDNGTLIPENECYCNGDCVPSGMINVSSCLFGWPIFLSLPNFYDADPIYLEMVEGLYPDKAKHEAYAIIEPNTGIPLQTSLRIQTNLLIHPIEDFSTFEDVREVFLPVFWFDQTTALRSQDYLLLKMLLMLPNIITVVGSILVALGVVLAGAPFKPLFISWIKKLKEQRPYISPVPEEIPLRHDDKNV